MTPAGVTAVGLLVDLIGAVLIGWDLFRPPRRELADHDLAALVPELCSATLDAIQGDVAHLEELEARTYPVAMAEVADRSRSAWGALVLRRWGRVGLGMVAVGFLLQFLGVIMSGQW